MNNHVWFLLSTVLGWAKGYIYLKNQKKTYYLKKKLLPEIIIKSIV